MVENGNTNMLFIIGKLTNLAEMMENYPAKDPDAYFEQQRKIGEDMGTFVRIAYGYRTPKQL